MANEDFVIEDGVLKEYKGKDKNVVIPNGVTSIGIYAFGYVLNPASYLETITIPDSITEINPLLFIYCYELNTIIVDENNKVFSSLDGVLYNKDKTKLFRCPQGRTDCSILNSVTSIENLAFCGCESLTSIKIPDGVISIGACAFLDCVKLTSITIPNSVTSIGPDAFLKCDNLKTIKAPKGLDLSKAKVPDGCEVIRY